MALLMLFEATSSIVMWLALIGAIGLTVWEVREHGFGKKVSMWWILLVVLTHVPGYLALRGFTAYRTRKAQA